MNIIRDIFALWVICLWVFAVIHWLTIFEMLR
jgi:hypothetical protein